MSIKLEQQNIPAASAYTEYSIVIPAQKFQLTLVLRPGGSTGSATPANLFWYMTTTNGSTPGSSSNLPQSPNTYNTIPLQNNRTINGGIQATTIYFQVDQPNQILEVDYFS
jgi:hypothetical protein